MFLIVIIYKRYFVCLTSGLSEIEITKIGHPSKRETIRLL